MRTPEQLRHRRRLLAATALGGGAGVLILPPAAQLAWWDANRGVYEDTGLTDLCEDGDGVAGWADQVGVNHVTQSTAGDRPIYRASVAALNGRAAIEFVSSDYLSRTIAAGLVANLNAYTIYAVIAQTTVGIGYLYSEGNSGAAAPIVGARVNGILSEGAHRDDASTLANPSGGATTNNGAKHLITLRRISSNSWSVRLDGAQVGTAANAPTTTTVDRLSIGVRVANTVASFVTGHIAQVALYSSDNFATVEPLLAAYYGITLP